MKDKRLEEMKNDYQNIPVPTELEQRVKAAITEAKLDLSQGEQKKHGFRITKWVARGAGLAVAAMLAITIMANSGESIAHAMGNIPILGSIVKIVTFREYSDSRDNMEANIKVPAVSVEDEEGNALEEPTQELNKRIEEYTSQIIAAYEADVAAAGGEGHKSVELKYTTVTDNDALYSLRFDQTTVMASGSQSVKIYNLDKKTGAILSLSDLFQENSDYIATLSNNIKEQMRNQMAADENVIYFLDSEVPETDFTNISEQANFYINEAGRLVVVFDEYEVAPGYMGSVEFEIPTEAIQSIVKEGYVK